MQTVDNELIVGATYTLSSHPDEYFKTARELATRFISICGKKTPVEAWNRFSAEAQSGKFKSADRKQLFTDMTQKLSKYIGDVEGFLAALPAERDPDIVDTTHTGYLLQMVEIEVFNLANKAAYAAAAHKLIFTTHCLRDFRKDECNYYPAKYEFACAGCNDSCDIFKVSKLIADKDDTSHYVFVMHNPESIYLEALSDYDDDVAIAVVSCIPELDQVMQLGQSLGIPMLGVPINYNRCDRWCKSTMYTDFHLRQLKEIGAC